MMKNSRMESPYTEPVRAFLIVLGVVLTAGSGAGVLLNTQYNGDRRMEEKFCRFAICDSTQIANEARKALWGDTAKDPGKAAADFSILLRREPHFPFTWVNLGDALDGAGKGDEARFCFQQAVELAPHWPPILLRAVNFHFRNGNSKAALPLASQILGQIREYDSEIFSQYIRQVTTADVLEHGLPRDNPRAAQAWLVYLVYYAKLADVEQTWTWANRHQLIDQKTSNAFIVWLLEHHPDRAAPAWREYMGPLAGDYGKSNYVFNGGFEAGFSGSPLDWTQQPTEGVEMKVDPRNPAEGAWSLRVQFDGQHNVGSTGLRQVVVLPSGRYRFKARIRTEGLTTDQGVQLRLSPAWATERMSGTHPWTGVEIPIVTDGKQATYGIELVRTPSQRFDNKISGTIWIDDVRIEPE